MTSRVAGGPARASRSAVILLSLCAVHALVRLVPWSSKPVGTDLDSSWGWAFHEVWGRPLACGRDVDFTHGPFGFLLTESYHPFTFAARVGLHAAVALLLVLALWRIVRAQVASRVWSLAWVLLLVEAMSVWSAQQNLFNHVDFAILWLHWSIERGRADERRALDVWLLHSLVAASALGALTKFTLFPGALVPLSAVAWREVTHERRPPWILLTFFASFVALWLFARQPLSALGPFLAVSAEITSAYSESMAVAGPVRCLALFLASALILLYLFAGTWGAGRPKGSAPHWLGFAGLLFLGFKSALVRFDETHSMPAASALLFWLAAWAVSRAGRRLRWVEAGALASALVLIPLLIDGILSKAPSNGVVQLLSAQVGSWPKQALAAARVLAGRTGYQARHERTLEEIRRAMPLPPLPGPVDVYPTHLGVVLAHGLDYRPRPVLQSYCAFTPRLLRLNASHLAGPLAPEEVLFTVVDWIDEHLPSMEDSLSWPNLLSRYEVVGVAGEHMVLRKRERPRAIHWERLEDRRARFGETISIPAAPPGSALWAEVDVHPTLLGRAVTLLYRPPILRLRIRIANGGVGAFRLVPGMARAGFLLSPVIEADEEYRHFAAQDRTGWLSRDVRAVLVGGREVDEQDDVTWAYGREYDIRLSILEIGP